MRISQQEQQAAARHAQSVRRHEARARDDLRREMETQQRKLQSAEIAEQQRVMLRAQMLP